MPTISSRCISRRWWRQDLLPAVGGIAGPPGNVALAGQVTTVFKGEALRSMLLNAYGWWKVSQITYIAALTDVRLGGLTAIGTGFALILGRTPHHARGHPGHRRGGPRPVA